LKKRNKKLLPVAGSNVPPDWTGAWEKQAKVFWFFFSKKNCFLDAWLSYDESRRLAVCIKA
jgi:hypothetical protein